MSPVPIRLGNQDFMLYPLTVADLGTFRQTARERAYDEVPARLAKLAQFGIDTPATREKVVFGVFQDIDTGRAEARFTSDMEGTALLVWLSVKHSLEHGTTPPALEQVRNWLEHADIPALQAKIDRVSFPGGQSPGPTVPAANLPSLPAGSTGDGSAGGSAMPTA